MKKVLVGMIMLVSFSCFAKKDLLKESKIASDSFKNMTNCFDEKITQFDDGISDINSIEKQVLFECQKEIKNCAYIFSSEDLKLLIESGEVTKKRNEKMDKAWIEMGYQDGLKAWNKPGIISDNIIKHREFIKKRDLASLAVFELCIRKNTESLDDGITSADVVGKVILESCYKENIDSATTYVANRLTEKEKKSPNIKSELSERIQSLVNSNLDHYPITEAVLRHRAYVNSKKVTPGFEKK